MYIKRKSILVEMGKTRFLDIILNLLLAGMVTTVVLFLFWGFRPYNIIEYKIDKFEMTKDSYVVGERLTYRTAFCKTGHYTAVQIRTIRDGVIYLYPSSTSSVDEGCYDFVASSTEVPNVPSGKYTFMIESIYKPNPLREIKYTMESEPFNIVNPN